MRRFNSATVCDRGVTLDQREAIHKTEKLQFGHGLRPWSDTSRWKHLRTAGLTMAPRAAGGLRHISAPPLTLAGGELEAPLALTACERGPRPRTNLTGE